jgi:metallo-beta-lactamase class B
MKRAPIGRIGLLAAAICGLAAPSGQAMAEERAGSLDKEIIRRIIRRHINEVKGCYDRELAAKPLSMGRVMVRFTIAPDGTVPSSELQSSTMGSPAVEQCAVDAVKRWEFPKPRGDGRVIVSYPFVFLPEPTVLVAGTKGAGEVVVEWIDPAIVVHRTTDAQGVPSNGLVAVTDAGLVLIDTAWTDAETETVLRWGETTLHRPWVGAIVTHDHADRVGGLGALFRRRVPVAALDLTVASLGRHGVRGVTTLFSAAAGAFADPRGFEVFYPGPGHAKDNVVVAFPAAHVVFGGCLVKSTEARDLGFTGDASLAAWPDAVRRVDARYPDFQTVVPGHGPVDRWRAAYGHTLELLRAAAPR